MRRPATLAWGAGLAAGLTLCLTGCGPGRPGPVYEAQGLHFKPPPGWSEWQHNEAVPAGQKQDRVLAQYHKSADGAKAWLTLAEVPPATSLLACLAAHAPWRDWRRAGDAANLEVAGQSAARLAWEGRQEGQDFIREVTAVRQEGRVFYFTVTLPAAAGEAREQVRQAIADSVWR